MKALYAGSFDPITHGHLDIIFQAYDLFDTVAIGVAVNPDKKYLFSADMRENLVIESLKGLDIELLERTEIYQYSNMTVEFAKSISAGVLVRGLRAVSDFDLEFQMTQFNRRLKPPYNTVFLMPAEKNFYLSSTAIRGIAKMGGDVSSFVTPCVVTALKKVFNKSG